MIKSSSGLFKRSISLKPYYPIANKISRIIPYFGYEYLIWRIPIFLFLSYQFFSNLYLFHATIQDNNTKKWILRFNINENIERKKYDTRDNVVDINTNEQLFIDNDLDEKEKNFCDKCNVVKYIRSQHCLICDICILRKDHHCFFLGGCVGISNQRFFFLTCFWLTIGSIYALSHYYFIYNNFFYQITEVKIIHIFFPMMYFISSIINAKFNLSNYLMIILCYLHFFALFIGIFFGSTNIYYILKGKTSYDYNLRFFKKIDVKPDGNTIIERLRFTFGIHWYINLILPNYWENIFIEENMIANIFYPTSKK